MPALSRPSISHDNPYSESLFKTLKYRPSYPQHAFDDLFAARQSVPTFVTWYNEAHRHRAIRLVTPAQPHAGLDRSLLAHRVDIYTDAQAKHPERWRGTTQNWQPIHLVHLNPEKPIPKVHRQKKTICELKIAA